MCKASIYADKVRDAQQGESLAIGHSSHGLPVFHEPGGSARACVACVKNGTALTIAGIRSGTQKAFGVGPLEEVIFVDTGDNQGDLVRFGNGREVDLSEFADDENVSVYVGTLAEFRAAMEARAAIKRAGANCLRQEDVLSSGRLVTV